MTPEQLEAAARAVCATLGVDPDQQLSFPRDELAPFDQPGLGPRWMLAARAIQRHQAIVAALA